MTVYKCPHCKGDFDVTPIHEGKVVACPMCKGSFQTSVPTATPPSLAVPTRSPLQGRPIYRRSRRHKPSQYSTLAIPILGCLVFLGTIGGVALYVHNQSGRMRKDSLEQPVSRGNVRGSFKDTVSVPRSDRSIVATIKGEGEGPLLTVDFIIAERGIYNISVSTLPSTKYMHATLARVEDGKYVSVGSWFSNSTSYPSISSVTDKLSPGKHRIQFDRFIWDQEFDYLVKVRKEELE